MDRLRREISTYNKLIWELSDSIEEVIRESEKDDENRRRALVRKEKGADLAFVVGVLRAAIPGWCLARKIDAKVGERLACDLVEVLQKLKLPSSGATEPIAVISEWQKYFETELPPVRKAPK